MDGHSADSQSRAIEVVLCVDDDAFCRLGSMWSHLCVGLLDLAVSIRLVTASAKAATLAFGPIKAIRSDLRHWPLRKLRFRKLIEELEESPPDLVHATSAGNYNLALDIAKRFDADLIAHVTSLRDSHIARELHYAHAVSFVVGSTAFESALSGHKPGGSTQTLIRPGVLCDTQVICFQDTSRVPTLLCTASMELDTGVEELVEAFRLLKARGRSFIAFFMGAGSREAQVRKRVAASDLRSQVIFSRPTGDQRSVMHDADVFIVPGPESALVESSLLALASGTAVVAVEGCVGDYYLGGATSVVCPLRAPASLADAIERLMADPLEARRLARGGLTHVKSHHSISVMVEKTYSVYQKAVSHRRTYALPAR